MKVINKLGIVLDKEDLLKYIESLQHSYDKMDKEDDIICIQTSTLQDSAGDTYHQSEITVANLNDITEQLESIQENQTDESLN